MKGKVTWVLVADGARARVYRNDGPGKGLVALPDQAASITIPPTRDLGTDRPGRTHDRFGPARHAMAPRADWHTAEKRAFAASLAERLGEVERQGAFDRLILVAPPKTLGDLRKACGAHVRDKVAGEISKDLTHATDSEIAEQVGQVLAV